MDMTQARIWKFGKVVNKEMEKRVKGVHKKQKSDNE